MLLLSPQKFSPLSVQYVVQTWPPHCQPHPPPPIIVYATLGCCSDFAGPTCVPLALLIRECMDSEMNSAIYPQRVEQNTQLFGWQDGSLQRQLHNCLLGSPFIHEHLEVICPQPSSILPPVGTRSEWAENQSLLYNFKG